MFERIVIPLDGSELAESILVQVSKILRRKDAEILLLRVVTLPPSTDADLGEPLDRLWSRATEYLHGVSERLSSEGVRVRCKAVEGFPANEILKTAEVEKATFIAMSTHGRTGLSRWVFGSVTEKVLRASSIPVLAVPSFLGQGGDAFPAGAREIPFKKIVVPIAAEELSLEVIPALAEFGELFGSRVFLVNVSGDPETPVPVQVMHQASELLLKGGISSESIVRTGDPATQILETSREQGADLIALTTHGRSGPSRWMMGSVAEKVLRGANLPLLVVRSRSKGLSNRGVALPVEFHSDP